MDESASRAIKLFGSVGVPSIVVMFLVAAPLVIYFGCRIEVPSAHIAILIKKIGKDITNQDEMAPSQDYKGVQNEVLGEGRYFYNPYIWDWIIAPQVEVPEGKLGVRTRLSGENLGAGELIAWEAHQKGIVPEVLRPGRYAINGLLIGAPPRKQGDSYAEHIALFNPVTVPAGFKGVVTNLAAPMPDDPNVLLVEDGRRGVQRTTLNPGTYYVNPFVTRIKLVDCRSQRFNLSQGGEMGFPSKDGFWVSLEGVIEFRVKPEQAAKVFVTYNDDENGERIDVEVINKIILPNARSYSRLLGSNHSGREFISGDTRVAFQRDFQEALSSTCESQGIEIIQALITKIKPPEKIATPVRQRQIALQEEKQFGRQILQQASEQELAVERELIQRKQKIVTADQEVVTVVTEAERNQEVALIEANQRFKVAEFDLKAATDQAAAIIARGKAVADIIRFNNEAEAAGWEKSVAAFNGDGDKFARWVLLKKMAPSFKSMMVNTADSPIMDMFNSFSDEATRKESGQDK